MQISRHWRMNAQRYRLEGVTHKDGSVSLQQRPTVTTTKADTRQAMPEQKTDLRESAGDAA